MDKVIRKSCYVAYACPCRYVAINFQVGIVLWNTCIPAYLW